MFSTGPLLTQAAKQLDDLSMGQLAQENKTLTRRVRSLLQLCLCSAVSLLGVSQAQAKCSTEVKLLLLPTQLQSAVKLFGAKRKSIGSVYFFDSNALELLSQGVIVRLRSSAISDLTVKLRPPASSELSGKLVGFDRYKCEIDLTGEAALRSYSIQTKFAGPLPTAGNELSELLSPAQRRLLEQANVAIDWSRISRVGEIKSTAWKIKSQSPFQKLALELWEWPTGTILELSTRAEGDDASSAYAQLRQFAVKKGLSLSRDQQSKTSLALEGIAHDPH